MDDKVKEVLLITQEECAEVTQAISKVFRFGLNERWPEPINPTNKERLEEEVGDLLCMIDIMVENGIISDENLNKARNNKRQKLKTWSSIFK
jgi:NTP pyrophosphatase (non-canonical NTP hydrolase)